MIRETSGLPSTQLTVLLIQHHRSDLRSWLSEAAAGVSQRLFRAQSQHLHLTTAQEGAPLLRPSRFARPGRAGEGVLTFVQADLNTVSMCQVRAFAAWVVGCGTVRADIEAGEIFAFTIGQGFRVKSEFGNGDELYERERAGHAVLMACSE